MLNYTEEEEDSEDRDGNNDISPVVNMENGDSQSKVATKNYHSTINWMNKLKTEPIYSFSVRSTG